MTPSVHYSGDAVTLWHGDARQVSEFIPADSVDLLGDGVWLEEGDGLPKWLCCTNSQLARWAREGIPMMSADRLATDLGLHVLNVWPDAYDDINTEEAA